MPKNIKDTKGKRVEGYGVFCEAYGGLIGFSNSMEMAEKLAKTEYAACSMSRSEDEFKVRYCTITYKLPKKSK